MQAYGGVVRFVVGPGQRLELHTVFDPDDAPHVLAGSHGYTKDVPFYREIAAAVGDALLTSDGDDWQRQRRIIQPLFTRQRITAYAAALGPLAAPSPHLSEHLIRILMSACVVDPLGCLSAGDRVVNVLGAAIDHGWGGPCSTQLRAPPQRRLHSSRRDAQTHCQVWTVMEPFGR
jgi:hypothetical protein